MVMAEVGEAEAREVEVGVVEMAVVAREAVAREAAAMAEAARAAAAREAAARVGRLERWPRQRGSCGRSRRYDPCLGRCHSRRRDRCRGSKARMIPPRSGM